MSDVYGFTLAVCAEMVFTDRPIEERARLIHDLGFAVEIWDWTAKDLDALVATGATFTSMTGYVDGGLTDPDGADALLRTAEQSVAAAAKAGDAESQPARHRPRRMRATPTTGRGRHRPHVAGRREDPRPGRRENLNTAVDHPGTPFGRAAETRALVQAVDSPHLRMNLDLYHAQIGEGNLIQIVRDSIDWIGEIQVADVPGRCEPGTGEINYPAIADALHEAGYTGVVGLEAWASGDSRTALRRFRQAFTRL
jgi:hydroxypyruvate isomerase